MLNGRPDHPQRAVGIYGASPTLHIYTRFAQVSVVGLRVRTIRTSDGALSPWVEFAASQVSSVDLRHQTMRLFTYNSELTPAGVTMGIAQ